MEWYLDMDPITVTGNCNFKTGNLLLHSNDCFLFDWFVSFETGSVSAFWLKAMYRMNNDVFNQLRQAGMYFDVRQDIILTI